MTRGPLIVVGPTPPPLHGVAFSTIHVLEGVRAAGRLAGHLDTKDPRPVVTTGRFDLTNVRLALRHSFELARMLRRAPTAGVYLPLSQGRWGFIRDAGLIWIARLFGRQVIVHLNGGLFREFYRSSPRPERVFIRATLRGVTEAWVLTPAHREMFEGLIPAERVHLLENAAEDMGASASTTDGPVRILYLANLVPEKGCFDLLSALERLDASSAPLEVRFVGEAEPEVAEEIARRARGLAPRGINVVWRGPKTGDDKRAEYAWANLFAYPTRYPPEGQPLVLLEAMSAGLPVISTDHSGVPYTVRDGEEGLIVPPGDIETLARAIDALVADSARRRELGEGGRRRYETVYTPGAFTTRIGALLTSR